MWPAPPPASTSESTLGIHLLSASSQGESRPGSPLSQREVGRCRGRLGFWGGETLTGSPPTLLRPSPGRFA